MELSRVCQGGDYLSLNLDKESLLIYKKVMREATFLDEKTKKYLERSIIHHISISAEGRNCIDFNEVNQDLIHLRQEHSKFRAEATLGLILVGMFNAGFFLGRSYLADNLIDYLIFVPASLGGSFSASFFSIYLFNFKKNLKNSTYMPIILNESRALSLEILFISSATSYFTGQKLGIVAGLNVAAAAFTYYNPNFVLGDQKLDNLVQIIASLKD